MAEEFDSINVNATATGTESIRNMRMELKELKGQLLTLPEGTDAYTSALKRAAEIADNMADSNLLVKNSAGDLDQVFGNLAKTSGQLVGGFGAVTAGMQLFGIENDSVVAGIAKLQQITAIAAGLEGIAGLGKGFKALQASIKSATVVQWAWNAAQAANPIGLVIAAVVALGAAIYALTSIQDDNTESIKRNQAALESLEKSNNTYLATQNERLEVLKIYGATTKEIAEAQKIVNDDGIAAAKEEIALIDEKLALLTVAGEDGTKEREERAKKEQEIADLQKNNRIQDAVLRAEGWAEEDKRKDKEKEDAKKIADANKKAYEDGLKSKLAFLEAAAIATEDGSQEELDANKKVLTEKFNQEIQAEGVTQGEKARLRAQYNKDLEQLDLDYAQIKIDNIVKTLNQEIELYKANNQSKLDGVAEYNQSLVDAENARITAIYDLEKAKIDQEITDEVDKQIALTELKNAYDATTAENQLVLDEQTKANRLTAAQDLYDAEMTLAQDNIFAQLDLQFQALEQEKALKLSNTTLTEAEKLKIVQAYAVSEQAIQREKFQASANLASGFAKNLATIFGESTKAGKAAAAAAVIIDGISGAIKAFNSFASIPVVGTVLGAAAAIAVGVSAAASVKKIYAVDDKNPTATAAAPISMPSIPPTKPEPASPKVPTVAAGQNQIQYVRQFRDTSKTELQPATKVYVLESDITEKQTEVSVAEDESTF
jgi:hypothetical protein